MTMDAPQHERMSTEQLFRHYAPFVERFLLRLGVNESSIDDVVQEVFLVAHRSGGYMPGPAKPTTYLATIAVHAASAHRRAQRSRAARCASRDIDDLVAPEHDPAQQLEARDSLRQLQSALDRLDDNLRTTLLMADGIGQTCPVIASAMDVPLGTVYWRLDRARKQFRAAWTTVSASKGTPRNASADGPRKHTSRGRRASALMVWWHGLWTGDEARDALRASCQPTAAELALAGTLTLRLAPPGTPLPAWASALPTTAPAALGVATVKLAGLSVATAAALAVLPHAGTPPGTHTGRVLESAAGAPTAAQMHAALASTAGLPASAAGSLSALTTPRSDSASRSALTSRLGEQAHLPALQHSGRTETSLASPSRAIAAGREAVSTHRAHTSGRASGRARHTTRRAAAESLPSSTTSNQAAGLVAPEERATAPDTRGAATLAPHSATPPAALAAQLSEAREVARAERLLATDPRGALRLLHSLASSASSQALREERDYIEVMALFRIGQLRDARAASTRFLKSYPESAFAGAIVSTALRTTTDS